MGQVVGYARVSTHDQSEGLQVDALRAAGAARVFSDTASGLRATRPELTALLDYVREGDTLTVWRLDRLGRSLPELLRLMALLDDRGIAFRSLTEGIDTTTPGGRMIFAVFGAVAQFERELNVERTAAGLAAAKARGARLGRPPALDANGIAKAIRLRRAGESLGQIAKDLNVSRSVIARATKSAE